MSSGSSPQRDAFQQWCAEVPAIRREQEWETMAAAIRRRIIVATAVPASILIAEPPVRDAMFGVHPSPWVPAGMVIVTPAPLAEDELWTPDLAPESPAWSNRPAAPSTLLGLPVTWTNQAAPAPDLRFGGSYRESPLAGLIAGLAAEAAASQAQRFARSIAPDPAAWALQEEYMAWRREPRVDPAAGPEAHALEPTVAQALQFQARRLMLESCPDMISLGFPEHEEGYAAA